MTRDHLESASKTLSRVLRHRPDTVGVTLDQHGWCLVDDLLAGLAATGTVVSREELQTIVETNNKRRFALSEDGTRIRANQGHSVEGVELQLTKRAPPSVLYHGTVRKNMAAIMKQGLLPMNRHHVHLSADAATAVAVGGRRGPPVILIVDAFRMHRDGHRFYISENGVWLTEKVPAGFLRAK
jgi:putative RNA 2'-phosphotransferase